MSQADELKKFKELLDNEIITEEEFTQKKVEILSQSGQHGQNLDEIIQSVRQVPKATGLQSNKSKIVSGLLGILAGTLGIHNFYLGYKTKGIIQLVLTGFGVLTTFLGIGVLVLIGNYIWAFVEGGLVMTSKKGSRWHIDAEGNDLQD